MEPRWYQQAAVDAVWKHISEKDGNPCVELPTGAGKSLVIAMLIRDVVKTWGGRVLSLAHRKELIEQNADKIQKLEPDIDVGIYSAGLKSRDTKHDCIVAGIQSVWNKADRLGRFDIVIVDEAHLIPKDGDGQFQTFLKDAAIINPNVRVIGLTATPYRLKEGLVCGPDFLLSEICYRVGVKELIAQGYLCKLTSKETSVKADAEGVRTRGGEFIASDLMKHLIDDEGKVIAACQEIAERTASRKSTLIFSAGREHGQLIRDKLQGIVSVPVGYVDGDTPNGERDAILHDFRRGTLSYLVNIDVLTTGFDATCIDCVAMLRPTLSPGLYYQMVGRGLRVDASKRDCLILDFGCNVERHGPIDKMAVGPNLSNSSNTNQAPTKSCEQCREILPLNYRSCLSCGYVFPSKEQTVKHETQASDKPVISEPETWPVDEVFYAVHKKRGAEETAPKTLRVTYMCSVGRIASEWVCVEHQGFARRKAEDWWKKRSDELCPIDAIEAVNMGNAGFLFEPRSLQIDNSGKWPQVIGYNELSEPKIINTEEINEDDIPF